MKDGHYPPCGQNYAEESAADRIRAMVCDIPNATEIRVAPDVYLQLEGSLRTFHPIRKPRCIMYDGIPIVCDGRARPGDIYALTQPVEMTPNPAWDPSHREIL